MSHTRFIELNEHQTIQLVKHNLSQPQKLEVIIQDKNYYKNKQFNVFICPEEIKAISILFEKDELNDLNYFYDFLYEIFSNPTKDQFYELCILNNLEYLPYFYIGVRNKYPYTGFGYVREKYKFKLHGGDSPVNPL